MRPSVSTSVSPDTARKSKRWQRERIVAGSFCGTVVARMNLTCGGGSSSVFRNASTACFERPCASSMM